MFSDKREYMHEEWREEIKQETIHDERRVVQVGIKIDSWCVLKDIFVLWAICICFSLS